MRRIWRVRAGSPRDRSRPSGAAPSARAVLAPLLLTALAAETGVRLLRPREPASVPAPVEAEEYFSPEEVRRGARFVRPQVAIGMARTALNLVALSTLVRRTERAAPSLPGPPEAGGALLSAGLAVGMTAVSLPLSALARRRAKAVGLITQSWGGWAADLGKSIAIEAALAAGAGGATLALVRRYPRGWWLPAAAGSVGLGTLLGTLAPVVLDPIFNDFTPLPAGQLRSDVLAMARTAGVEVGEVFTVDASRRTTGANAYVAGLGPTKRVVLFDTLIDRYSPDEVRVVVAHELSHVRHRDVWRGIAYSALVAPTAALAVQRLSWALSPQRGTPAVLPALGLSAALVMAPTALIGNRLSRALERRADDYSLALSKAPEAFISFERKIALQNVADLRPPRWLTAVLSTHPPTLERIGAAVTYSRAGQAAA